MASMLYPVEAAHYAAIAKRVRERGDYGGPVTSWREDYVPGDNTMRLLVRREELGYDMVFCADADELHAFEQERASDAAGDVLE